MNLLLRKSDFIGALSSGLCLIHCFATPFLFAAQAHFLECCHTQPIWWSVLDLVFLLISLGAIYNTTKNTTNNWIKIVLWFSWALLLVIVLNEKIEVMEIPEAAIYFPSLSLIFFHVYNSKYCKCKDNVCCVSE
ncbi:MerC domain-containing protein [Aquimarina agarivorans]|uniref:MerC domain-containing protein n=1 Tax=Aquimarina agarivorans TaxID=980584 RepID=UPI000248FAB3|nr:MerC domain-containing protein [Aquimarina agarivorans]